MNTYAAPSCAAAIGAAQSWPAAVVATAESSFWSASGAAARDGSDS